MLNENAENSKPIPIEGRQPLFDHAHVSQPIGRTHEVPHHNLANFEPRLGYTHEGQTIGGVPLPNTLEGSQYYLQLKPLHFAVGSVPPAMTEKGKFDHIEERLKAIEGGGDYAFVDIIEWCLVPDVIIPSKFKVPNFDKY